MTRTILQQKHFWIDLDLALPESGKWVTYGLLFVCLFVCSPSSGHSFALINSNFFLMKDVRPGPSGHYFGESRSKVKVKVTQNVKITEMTISSVLFIVKTSN